MQYEGKYAFTCGTMLIQLTQKRTVFAYNFFNNGFIFRLLALLEFSQSPLCIQCYNVNQLMQMKENMDLHVIQCSYKLITFGTRSNGQMPMQIEL